MSQVVTINAIPRRANLNVCQVGGSLADTVLPSGEYLAISTSNNLDSNGQGTIDAYIVGDGVTACKNLVLKHLYPENGFVYDISIANNNAQYVSLTAALGNNGANIPEDIRRGGMSIKFINSGSGKYEQWNLKASSWSTNVDDWVLNVDGSNIPIDKIEVESAQSEEQAVIYETDAGVQVGKIDSTGADFTDLKRGGQQVARMTDLPTKDSSIGENPSTTHVPTTAAVKEYVDENSMKHLPMSEESTQSEDEELVASNDAGTDTYVKVGSYGVKAKAYMNMQGNPIIAMKNIDGENVLIFS